MKSFLKNVLANIVAIVILCMIFFTFFIAIIGIAAVSAEDSKPVTKQTVLVINDKMSILDSPTEESTSIMDYGSKTENTVTAYNLIQAIEKAKTDDNVSGISIETDQINSGITHLDNLRNALKDFKKSGKFVYAYGNNQTQSSYYLATVADKVFLHPAGGIDLKGLASETLFFKDFADKYGIGVEIIRHGKFKAAVEPYFRNDMSEENRLQMSTLLNDIWGNINKEIASSRKLKPEQIATITDSLYGMFPEKSVEYKLVDKLGQKSDYDALIKNKLGLTNEEKINRMNIASYASNPSANGNPTNQVAILYASGGINTGSNYNEIYSENYLKEIKKIEENDNIKALVLRVNSPGGSANASDEILFALKNLKTKKPLVVSFGDYAASGGYYISMAADKIYSEPNTITGSIGVFGVIPYFKEIANKNGIHSETVKTNANSDYMSSMNGLTPYGMKAITHSVENTYARFVNFVSANRKMTFDQVDAIGGGRVWSGTRAKTIGLVDEIGTLNDAVKYASQKAKMKDYEVVTFPSKQSMFQQLFKMVDSDDITARIVSNKIGKDNYNLIQQAIDAKDHTNIQMLNTFKVKY